MIKLKKLVSCAVMAAGLGMLGFLKRRRKAQGAAAA